MNQESLTIGLDLINELIDKRRIRKEACKILVARRHNSKVKPRNFQKGDLVWRMRNEVKKNEGKFSRNLDDLFA